MPNPLYSMAQIIMSSGRSRLLGVITLFLLAAAIPLTVYVAQQQQEVRQRAQSSVNCAGVYNACRGQDGQGQDQGHNFCSTLGEVCASDGCAAVYNTCRDYANQNFERGGAHDYCSRLEATCSSSGGGGAATCGYEQKSEEYDCSNGQRCWNDFYKNPGTDCQWQPKDPRFHCDADASCGGSGQTCGYDQTSRQYACSGGFKCYEDFFKDQSTGCQWQYKDPHFHCNADPSCTGGSTPAPPVGGQPPDGQPPSGPTCEFGGRTYNPSDKRYECNNPKIQGPCADNAGVGVPFVCEESGWSNFNPAGECATDCKPDAPPPPTGDNACRDNPAPPPSGYKWKADCSRTCDTPCPKNDFDPDNVNPEDSAWCYGFGSGSGSEARCMILVRPTCQKAGDPGCRAPTATPTPTGRQRDRDRDRDRGGGGRGGGGGGGGGRRPTNTPTPTRTIISCSTTSDCPTGFICIPDRCVPISPTPSGGATPTPTFTPGGTQLAFTISLIGIGDAGESDNPRHSQRELKVEVFNAQNQRVADRSGTITYQSASGRFTGTIDIGSVSTGNYTVKVKTNQFLRRLIPGIQAITSGRNNTMPHVQLLVGDINNDNAVDIIDYNIFIGCFQDKSGTSSCTNREGSDLDDDGDVDGVDYNLFIRSLAVKQGD